MSDIHIVDIKEFLTELLEELSHHDYSEVVIKSQFHIVTIQSCTVQQQCEEEHLQQKQISQMMTIYAPQAGTLVLSDKIQPGLAFEAGKELAQLQILEKKSTIVAAGQGIIETVLVENGEFVEYRQALFCLSIAS